MSLSPHRSTLLKKVLMMILMKTTNIKEELTTPSRSCGRLGWRFSCCRRTLFFLEATIKLKSVQGITQQQSSFVVVAVVRAKCYTLWCGENHKLKLENEDQNKLGKKSTWKEYPPKYPPKQQSIRSNHRVITTALIKWENSRKTYRVYLEIVQKGGGNVLLCSYCRSRSYKWLNVVVLEYSNSFSMKHEKAWQRHIRLEGNVGQFNRDKTSSQSFHVRQPWPKGGSNSTRLQQQLMRRLVIASTN